MSMFNRLSDSAEKIPKPDFEASMTAIYIYSASSAPESNNWLYIFPISKILHHPLGKEKTDQANSRLLKI